MLEEQKSIDVKFGNDDHYCVIEYSLWLKQPVVMKYIYHDILSRVQYKRSKHHKIADTS